ncbi:MAG TPA: ATP-binding protein, partial [Gemmatimonadaceae bacterium]|nr:ATP-binding protein [Gemmatimonadaceae bacterium]
GLSTLLALTRRTGVGKGDVGLRGSMPASERVEQVVGRAGDIAGHGDDRDELVAAAGDLVGALDLDEQLRRLARRARRMAGGDFAAVATVNADGSTVWRALDGAVSDRWRTVVFPPGRGTAGRVIAHNGPLVISDFPRNPEFPVEEFPAHAAEGMRTAFGVPLRQNGEPFGAIVVGWRRQLTIPPAAIDLVQALADLAAAAIVRAELFAQVSGRAAELEALNAELGRSRHQLEEQAMELESQQAELEEHQAEMELLNAELRERNVALAERVTLFNVVLDQMADGVIIADASGRLRRINPAAARMHGRAVTDVTLEEWSRSYDLLRPDGTPYPPAELPLARALARNETVEGADWLTRRPDGTLVRLLGSAAPLHDAGGRALGAVLVMRDITERARLVEELRSATTAKERFFAQMSHELRTPVNAVLGYAALLADGTAGALPPKAAEMVGRIARSARHLRELVDDLLDISRLEAGKVQLAVEEVALAGLLRDTLTSLEPQARAKGLALELRAAEVPRLRTDAKRVRQIVLNLASNAVKFTERGSVTIGLEPHDGGVAVHVTDTGVGIAGADLERIFDEFVQVGTAHGGTGLGLAISRRLARLLGGDLEVRSAPAEGSRFTLTLPAGGPPGGRGGA